MCLNACGEKGKKLNLKYGWWNGRIVPEDRCPRTPCVYHVPAKESEIHPHTVIQTLDSKVMESVLSNNGTLTGSFR